MNDVLVGADELRRFVAALLEAVGVEGQDAGITAEVLVAADLRGHESHGVARLEDFYVRPIQAGEIEARARLAVVHETAATLALDAGNGLGQPACKRALARHSSMARLQAPVSPPCGTATTLASPATTPCWRCRMI